MACNERCPFCNVPVEDYPTPTPPVEQTDAEFAEFLRSGERTLTISGGEPTLLRKRLVDVIARARAGGIPFVEVQTNAILIDPGYARELREAGLTSAFVSLLSDEPALHDELAGLAGAFPRCLAGIDALLDAGVSVTLNPVVAIATQERVPDYVDFVAARFPRIRSISLSAVQPHGRAAAGAAALLPDYSVLARAVPEARRRARARGIELLNPYCGLPLCVGWADDLGHSVEAIEAEHGGWRQTPGIENVGDKEQREPCRRCAFRTRCGGAWTAYWEVRAGRGLAPPAEIVEPWRPGADDAPAQVIVRGSVAAAADSLRQARAPTVWLAAPSLEAGDATRLSASGCTDVALEIDATGLAAGRPSRAVLVTLREARALARSSQALPASRRVRVHVRAAGGTEADQDALTAWVLAGL
jgi:MoaA/NifB/PqqE/SkfB family radical SAM enzyme